MSLLSSEQVGPPSEAVVERVANREGVHPLELDPLYEVIDPSALDALVRTHEQKTSGLQITFVYHGYEVTVTAEGVVHVDEVTSTPQTVV